VLVPYRARRRGKALKRKRALRANPSKEERGPLPPSEEIRALKKYRTRGGEIKKPSGLGKEEAFITASARRGGGWLTLPDTEGLVQAKENANEGRKTTRLSPGKVAYLMNQEKELLLAPEVRTLRRSMGHPRKRRRENLKCELP